MRTEQRADTHAPTVVRAFVVLNNKGELVGEYSFEHFAHNAAQDYVLTKARTEEGVFAYVVPAYYTVFPDVEICVQLSYNEEAPIRLRAQIPFEVFRARDVAVLAQYLHTHPQAMPSAWATLSWRILSVEWDPQKQTKIPL